MGNFAAKYAEQLTKKSASKGSAVSDGGSSARSNVKDTPSIQRAKAAGEGVKIETKQKFASKTDEQLYDTDGQFAPKAFGGTKFTDGQDRVVTSKDRSFDRKGELNAYDNRDALTQIKHILDTQAQTRSARLIRSAESFENRQARIKQIARAASDDRGYRMLGQEILQPIKAIVDYEAFGRKCFQVRPFEQNEFFRLTKDVRATAFVIGQDGQGVESRVGGKYVDFPEYKIGSFPTVDIQDIYQMGYDVLDRVQDTARQEIELEEDKRAIAVIDAAATSGSNSVIGFVTLGIGAFEDIRFQVERNRIPVDKFAINRAELSDVIKTMSTQVDPVTERELILAGYIGSILNASIITSAGIGVEEVVPAGTVYAMAAPELLGVMGIRFELFSEPFNQFAQFRTLKGYAFCEMIGHCIPEPWKVAKGVAS